MFFEFALIGTTASGKTDLANALAKEFDACILSLDSLCVYKQINIASAKTDEKILNQLKYFGVNLINIDEHFNTALFFEEYKKAKQYAMQNNKILIITGGTSFYLKALMDGLSDNFKESQSLLNNNEIYTLMQQIDKYSTIEKNDTYRLKKWLGIYEQTKKIPSEVLKETRKDPLIKNLEIYDITWDKKTLEKRIIQRTQNMLKEGLIDEAKTLFQKFDKNLKALNCIGLKECKDFLDNKITLEKLEELIVIHTRQLAKRQRTFNKKFHKTDILFKDAYRVLREKLLNFSH
ncbi:tRNA (adenosine(37)-N6)-dimethylallyltransferase MiaA [Campylobacter insulaenigrae]|uniref:tRNA (adenosine(37)-N6)-dimethylallyltransferase MiaA n=1 Tax=Campylobacter insulaenigrae TaxID=260714 RepID=UPI000F71B6A2|nr:tRNA (adenosine(37)-N6)-dimethylallyltransferase MiaA [Campylobacter insulaenigrae]MCR6571000.1 tRNA (adenosine(37)-N6)-dimethylallyltransferase MiaA [Campylobacter insulaenigrae]MCR6572580.1 tRNA (adenosine(37)-N6)-dimethylallyltransferase MiaA [Campylobacter insulaenigrae]MCR6573934.1 tRNA (adenosine(37)-N6)-dimethylallyltransferase MiaA [Campylobacter insulaenigrae]MCR6575672.1 tRNA (adenosine(37)-N6)-dimethylallyltransferase MiaA [Campylobacter insulaenigrae]MCR6576954.1 tRNA (adenosine